jgi:hypothetical protein
MVLFDDFCERRSTVALAYLLSAWPLREDFAQACRKLHATLTQLQNASDAELTNQNQTILRRLISLLSRQSLHPAGPRRREGSRVKSSVPCESERDESANARVIQMFTRASRIYLTGQTE